MAAAVRMAAGNPKFTMRGRRRGTACFCPRRLERFAKTSTLSVPYSHIQTSEEIGILGDNIWGLDTHAKELSRGVIHHHMQTKEFQPRGEERNAHLTTGAQEL